MEHFTPVSALIGGLLIGSAALVLWVADGRIAGISGILGGLPESRGSDTVWRIAFLAGLILAPVGYRLAAPTPPAVHITASLPLIVAGGLLVGFGTRLGSGCTSGHGVCGMARLSKRSIAATAIFMGIGFATVLFTHHLLP